MSAFGGKADSASELAAVAEDCSLWRITYPLNVAVLEEPSNQMEFEVAKKLKKIVRREYTKADVKELRAHSKAKTPLAKLVKLTKRTEGSLRQKALKLGIRLGHRR
jgi:hypothetical protein